MSFVSWSWSALSLDSPRLPPLIQDVVFSNSNLTAISYPPFATPAARLSRELSDFRTEYKAMLYGGQVRPCVIVARAFVEAHVCSHTVWGLPAEAAPFMELSLPLCVVKVLGSVNPHYALSDSGIATTDNPGRGILYPSGMCTCPPGNYCDCVPTGVCMCLDQVWIIFTSPSHVTFSSDCGLKQGRFWFVMVWNL